MSDVIIKFSQVGADGVQRVFEAQNVAIDQQAKMLKNSFDAAVKAEGGMKKMGAVGSQYFEAVSGTLKGVVSGLLGAGGVVGAFEMWRQGNQALLQDVRKIGNELDVVFGKINTQFKSSPAEMEAFKPIVHKQAIKHAVDESVVAGAATTLDSVGFTGNREALVDEYLSIRSASNQQSQIQGESAPSDQEQIEAIAGYAQGQGLELTPDTLRRVGRQVVTLGEKKSLNVRHMRDLSQVGSSLAGRMSVEEQLAAFALLQGTQGSQVGATSLRNMVSFLGTPDDQATKALGTMNINPADVDFQGEDAATVLSRLREGLSKVAPAQRDDMVQALVKRESAAGFQILLDKIDEFRELTDGQKDSSQFEKAVQIAESGRSNAAKRQELVRRQELVKRDDRGDLLLGEIKIEAIRQGHSGGRMMYDEGKFYSFTSLGMSPEKAAYWAYGADEHDVARMKARIKEKDELRTPAFLDDGDQPISIDARRADLVSQRDAAIRDRDSGQRWSFSWNRDRERQEAQGRVDYYERMIAALERNSASNDRLTSANGGVERPPEAPASSSLATSGAR